MPKRDPLQVPDDRLHSRQLRPPRPDLRRPQSEYQEEILRLQHERSELGAAAFFTPISAFLTLPHLRAFWPMSSADEQENVYDISGQGRTLSKQGSPILKNLGFTPYADLDGNGYYQRTDEAGLSITDELTIGSWVYLRSGFSDVLYLGKMAASGSGNLSYGLHAATVIGTERFQLHISDDGSNDETVHVEPVEPLDAWNFVVGRFSNQSSAIYCNTQKVSDTPNATGIYDGTAAFELGRARYTGVTTYLDGLIAYPFLCASRLSDTVIANIFQATRAIFDR